MILLLYKAIVKDYQKMTKTPPQNTPLQNAQNTLVRLDIEVCKQIKCSRAKAKDIIKNGFVKVGDEVVKKASYLFDNANDTLQIDNSFEDALKPQPKQEVQEEILKPDYEISIVYEDDDILVINKPYGVVVHGGVGVSKSEYLLTKWLSDNKIKVAQIGDEYRYGIVHRLDKPTSGLLVVAKSDSAYISLKQQLKDKSMGRYYMAITNKPLKNNMIIDKAITSNVSNNKKKPKMILDKNGKSAKSMFVKVALSDDGNYEIIKAKLHSGRTHQIRVHLHSLNISIVGDTLYGFKGKNTTMNRIFLHSYYLFLKHPTTNKDMVFKAPLHSDMQEFINARFKKDLEYEKLCSFDNFSSEFAF